MPTDILLDTENLDLQLKGGDFATGESTRQHQNLFLVTGKGHWRQAPAVGVSLQDYLDADDLAGFQTELQKQLELDGMVEIKVSYGGLDNLNITGKYVD